MTKNILLVIMLIVVVIAVLNSAIGIVYSTHVEKENKPPELIASYKVGDEPSIHRVWRVVVDGKAIEYVEIVNDWR